MPRRRRVRLPNGHRPNAVAKVADLLWPTRSMVLAYRLREQQGKNDTEIGQMLNFSREWVCKLRAEYERRMKAVELVCAEVGDASMVRRLFSND